MSYIRNQSHNKISKLKFNNLAKIFPVGKDSFGKSYNWRMFFHSVVLDCGNKRLNSPWIDLYVPHSYMIFSCFEEFDECSSSPCLNGGTCTDGINNYTCSCPSPFFGRRCQGMQDIYCSIYCSIFTVAKPSIHVPNKSL